MRFIPIKTSENTRRSFKERTSAEVKRATLWPVNDDEKVHDAMTQLGRLDSEQLYSSKKWTTRFMEGLRRSWEKLLH